MESLATLVPFEVDWARVVVLSALRVVAILLVGALAYVVLRVVRNRVGRMPIEAWPGTIDRPQRRARRTVWHRRLGGDPADDPAFVGAGQRS